jgi:hypothetical protein
MTDRIPTLFIGGCLDGHTLDIAGAPTYVLPFSAERLVLRSLSDTEIDNKVIHVKPKPITYTRVCIQTGPKVQRVMVADGLSSDDMLAMLLNRYAEKIKGD